MVFLGRQVAHNHKFMSTLSSRFVWALIHPSFSCAGEAIGASVASFLEDAMVFEVEYCACCHLQRNILSNSSQASSTENFRVLTESGQTGVSYSITPEFSWRKSEAYCKLQSNVGLISTVPFFLPDHYGSRPYCYCCRYYNIGRALLPIFFNHGCNFINVITFSRI